MPMDVWGRYIDELVSMRRCPPGQTPVGSNLCSGGGPPMDYYFHADDNYNIMAVTNSTGAVAERYEYGDFGEPQFLNSAGGAATHDCPASPPGTCSRYGNPYLFTGREYDPESRLYNYRTRYLDPEAGRFITRDTIGIWGDQSELGNGYSFVANSPFDVHDPFGRQAGGGGSGAGASAAVLASKAAAAHTAAKAAIAAVANGTGSVQAASVLIAAAVSAAALAFGDDVAMALQRTLQNALKNAQKPSTPQQPRPSPKRPPRIPVSKEDKDWKDTKPHHPVPELPTDPSQPPGEGWEWKGKGPPGSPDGSWVHPEKGKLHPHQDSPKHGPHWDWRDPDGNDWRIPPDGPPVPKRPCGRSQ